MLQKSEIGMDDDDELINSDESNHDKVYKRKLKIIKHVICCNMIINILILLSTYMFWSFGIFDMPWLWIRLYDHPSNTDNFGKSDDYLLFEGQFRFY